MTFNCMRYLCSVNGNYVENFHTIKLINVTASLTFLIKSHALRAMLRTKILARKLSEK